MFGDDRPTVVPGPSGPISIVGIVFEGDEATVDNGALHARSHLEAGTKFSDDPATKGKGERVVNVWVACEGVVPERFLGAVSCELWVDRASGRGYKKLIEHVNRMSHAAGGRIDLPHLSPAQAKGLGRLLGALSPAAWERTGEALRAKLL